MKYSILIPAYKRTYLKECIDSVLSIDYADYEVIILNDASPEGLDEIINEYPTAKIRYYKNTTNVGALKVVDNWNKLLEYAKGDYVICIGDDDKMLPQSLNQYDKIISLFPTLDVYHGWTEIIDQDSKPIELLEPRPLLQNTYQLMWSRLQGEKQYIGDFCFRTSALRAKGGFKYLPMAWYSDDITVYTMGHDKGVANTQEPVFQYRFAPQTLTNSGNTVYKLDAIEQWKEWMDEFLSQEPADGVSRYYYNLIKNSLQYHYTKAKRYRIIEDISKGGLSKWWFWVKQRKERGLTMAQMIGILKSAAKNRYL